MEHSSLHWPKLADLDLHSVGILDYSVAFEEFDPLTQVAGSAQLSRGLLDFHLLHGPV